MSFLAKKAPVWAVVLSALAATGISTVAFMALPALSDATQASRDFSVSTSSSPVTVEQGTTATSTITITSLSSFDLATGLTTTISPPTSELTVHLNPSVVTPPANAKTTSSVTITASPRTPVGTYTVTLTATGGTKTHTATLTIIVAAVPDFTITSSLTSLIVYQNAANTTTLTLTSIGSFSGNVSLTVTAPFATLGVAGGQSPLHLTAGGTNTTSLAVYASSQTPLGTYTLTVTGTSGSLVHTLNIPITVKSGVIGCGPPMCGTEALNLEADFFTSTTNVTLYLRNTGSASLTLQSYYVKDASGDQWVNLAWTGPTINVNAVAGTQILIGSSCPSCTLVGSPFTFTGGNSYTILVVTARNNQFTFTVVSSNPVESLSLVTYSFSSSTNATLYLRSTGSTSVRLTSYYVRDTSGDMYTRTTWSGQTIFTNSSAPVSILIGSSCSPDCSLTGTPFNFTAGHSYTVIVATANGNQFGFTVTYSAGLESLSLESYVFTSSTNVTLGLRNFGSTSISLDSYYVSDTSNNTYAQASWAGPTITANTTASVSFPIGSSCPSCTLTGTPFTFTPGNSYTIIIVTGRNNTFRFTITR